MKIIIRSNTPILNRTSLSDKMFSPILKIGIFNQVRTKQRPNDYNPDRSDLMYESNDRIINKTMPYRKSQTENYTSKRPIIKNASNVCYVNRSWHSSFPNIK